MEESDRSVRLEVTARDGRVHIVASEMRGSITVAVVGVAITRAEAALLAARLRALAESGTLS